jgi:hypothetical protein
MEPANIHRPVHNAAIFYPKVKKSVHNKGSNESAILGTFDRSYPEKFILKYQTTGFCDCTAELDN